MALVKLLTLLLLFVERDYHLAKAYLELKSPSEALNLLNKIPESSVSDDQQFEIDLAKAQSLIELNQPLPSLAVLQQLIALQGLSPSDKDKIYELISLAFIKLQQPKRAAYFNNLNSTEWLPSVPENTTVAKSPFEQAIALQTKAMDLTIALPFFTTDKSNFGPASEAQKQVQTAREPFVKLLYTQEQNLTPDCVPQNYAQVTNAFAEGLSLAKVAGDRLQSKKQPFAEIVPIQKSAIDKFKEAKEAFERLPPPNPNPQAQQNANDLKDLENMMQDEKLLNKKPIPSNTDRVIW